MIASGWSSTFVGRTDELGQCEQVLAAVLDGEPRCVIVGGEAGVGKSRFLARMLDGDQAQRATVLSGASLDLGGSPLSFGPVLSALRSLSRQLDDETRRHLVDPLRAKLAGLVPESDSPHDHGSSSQAQLFELTLTLLEELSARFPMILVIEDLQWADRSTRDLLAFLVTNLAGSRVGVILTYRSDELSPGHELRHYLSHLQRSRGVLRLHLPRFGRAELELHLISISGDRAHGDVLDAIWQRSQGNPFYAEELMVLARGGDLTGMPTALSEMLLGRLKMLAPATQTIVRLAAAGGTSVDHRLLIAVVEGDDADLDEGLREAMEHNILMTELPTNEVGGAVVRFRHTLLQEVAYGDMLPSERRLAHARYARQLRALAGSGAQPAPTDAELARHHLNAGEHAQALVAAISAASSAGRAQGYAESWVHLERAVSLWEVVEADQRPPGMDRYALLERTAAVAHLHGNNGRAIELARSTLAELGDGDGQTDRSVRLSVALSCYLTASGESEEALRVLEGLIDPAPDRTPGRQADVLCAYARSLMAVARHRDSLYHGRRALAIARAAGDRVQEADALATIGSNLVVLGEPGTGAKDLFRALELAEEIGASGKIASGYGDLLNTLSGPLNRLDEALELALRGISRVGELGLERHWGVSLRCGAADTLFRLGRWDEADVLLEEAIRRSAKGAPAVEVLLARAKVSIARGRFDGATEDLAAVRSLSARSIDLRYWVPLHTLAAGLALWQGAVDDARAAVEAGLGQVQETDDLWFVAPLVWHGLRAEAERAELARVALDPTEVERAVARAEELASTSGQLRRRGAGSGVMPKVIATYDLMCAGELGRVHGQPAVEAWAQASGSWDDLGHRYPATYARWQWAQSILAGRRAHASAGPLLRRARLSAIELGALPMLAGIERTATRHGIDLDSPDPQFAVEDVQEDAVVTIRSATDELVASAGLTRREAEVLALVAAGDSNRRIADALFISEKTASVHVSHIMSKLDVSSRVQVAALLHRRQELWSLSSR